MTEQSVFAVNEKGDFFQMSGPVLSWVAAVPTTPGVYKAEHARLSDEAIDCVWSLLYALQNRSESVEVAPWARHADFVVVCYGDRKDATLLRGWDALCDFFIECHYFKPDADQRAEVMARLTDWEEWNTASDGFPYQLYCSYEDGDIQVLRLTETSPALKCELP